MSGPEGAAALVAGVLTADLPGRLTALEAALGVAPGRLPPPQLLLPRDEVELRLEDFPAVLVVPMESTGVRRLDADGSSETFLVRYSMRVYVWARGEHADDTDLMRKRLTLACRQTLLGHQQLGTGAVLTAPTFTESYSDLGEAEDRSTVAAAYLAFQIDVEETVSDVLPPAYTAQSAVVDVSLLPHPALD